MPFRYSDQVYVIFIPLISVLLNTNIIGLFAHTDTAIQSLLLGIEKYIFITVLEMSSVIKVMFFSIKI